MLESPYIMYLSLWHGGCGIQTVKNLSPFPRYYRLEGPTCYSSLPHWKDYQLVKGYNLQHKIVYK